MKKTMNKVIAATMMAITLAMPAMAGNKNHNGKKDKVVAVNNKKVSHFDKKVVAKAEHMKGVMNTKWNPRTRELTVIYDAKVTSARHIMHFMA